MITKLYTDNVSPLKDFVGYVEQDGEQQDLLPHMWEGSVVEKKMKIIIVTTEC